VRVVAEVTNFETFELAPSHRAYRHDRPPGQWLVTGYVDGKRWAVIAKQETARNREKAEAALQGLHELYLDALATRETA
jgi:hypothetical protein